MAYSILVSPPILKMGGAGGGESVEGWPNRWEGGEGCDEDASLDVDGDPGKGREDIGTDIVDERRGSVVCRDERGGEGLLPSHLRVGERKELRVEVDSGCRTCLGGRIKLLSSRISPLLRC